MTLPVEYNAADSQREIDNLQQQITRMEQFLRMQPLDAAPINPESGYLAVSDGTGSGFDSISGAGVYRFDGSAWVSLEQENMYVNSEVETLSGGATTETLDISIPSGRFSSKPTVASLTESSSAQQLLARYEFDDASSTATNARFTIFRNDGGNISSGLHRFGFVSFE